MCLLTKLLLGAVCYYYVSVLLVFFLFRSVPVIILSSCTYLFQMNWDYYYYYFFSVVTVVVTVLYLRVYSDLMLLVVFSVSSWRSVGLYVWTPFDVFVPSLTHRLTNQV